MKKNIEIYCAFESVLKVAQPTSFWQTTKVYLAKTIDYLLST